MKKEDVSGIIVYVLIVALALVFCLTILRSNSINSGMDSFQYWLFIVGAVISGTLINAILYELAHTLGAKAGGYEIVSVNILGLMFYKNEDGKRKVKFGSFDGLTGETKILPKYNSDEKQSNPRPYLLFGSLFFAIEIIATVFVFVIFGQSGDQGIINLGHFILTIGVVGGIILLYNIIPMRLDSKTDGYQLTLLSNPKNKIAFNELLRVEYEIAHGNSDVEIKTFDVITNYTADLNLNKVYSLLDKKEYAQAEELLELIIDKDKDISFKTKLRAVAQKLYIELMTKTNEEARQYYDKEVDLSLVRQISKDISMPSIRAYILVAGLMDKSRSETILSLKSVYKAYKHTPKSRKNTEAMLLNEAIDRIVESHPTWDEIPQFKINIEEKETK